MNGNIFTAFMTDEYQRRLIQIVNESWLIDALRTVRSLKLPDWYIAAGAIRNTVWNTLHGYSGMTNQHDVDVVYFDSTDMIGKKEREYEHVLMQQRPSLRWEVVNQARAHVFNSRPQVYSSCESIAYWSETPTCVGVRLADDGSLSICAPHGLEDLMNLVVRPIPKPYQDIELYNNRMKQKIWNKTWPQLRIIRT